MTGDLRITRGYFSLGDREQNVTVTSSKDFQVFIWARNISPTEGGVQVSTPSSPFRTPGSTGPLDGLVLSVPAETGSDLGCIGGLANETIQVTNSGGATVVVFLTVSTSSAAVVEMVGIPR